jgi:hypothetical protein
MITATMVAAVATPTQPALAGSTNPVTSANQTASRGRWLGYLGIGAVVLVFVIMPIGLLGLGGLVWWLRRH